MSDTQALRYPYRKNGEAKLCHLGVRGPSVGYLGVGVTEVARRPYAASHIQINTRIAIYALAIFCQGDVKDVRGIPHIMDKTDFEALSFPQFPRRRLSTEVYL